MSKEQKFEKVVKWARPNMTDKDVLIWMFFCMIPIIGQLVWIFGLRCALRDRKVYWRKIK